MRSYLLVDDNRALAENLAEILRDQGHEAWVTHEPARALEQVRNKQFDALVTDMRMPGMNGAELLHEARKQDPGLAVIVLTAYSGEADLRGVEREGVLAVLPKPIPIREMTSLLSSARRDGLVLMVEDDVGLGETLTQVLRERGFTTVAARSTHELERLRDLRPFAALVDLRVPGSPNGEVLLQLSQRFEGLPLVAMTGNPEINPPRATYKLFAKPFSPFELLDAVETLHRARKPA